MVFKRSLFIAVLLAILSGCGQSHFIDGPLSNEREEPDVEQIEVWHTYSDEETRIFEKEVIPAFEKIHPEIKVISVRQPYSTELKYTLISRATSGKAPDLVRVDISWMPELVQLGTLYPLSAMPGFHDVIRPLHSISLKTNEYSGEYFGLPVDVNTKIAVYNTLRLQEAGLSKPPGTIEEIFAYAKATGTQVGMDGFTTWSATPYFFALGGKMLDSENKHAIGYLNSPESIKAMQALVGFKEQGLLNQDLLFGKGDRWQGVLNGSYFMMDEGPWFYSVLANSSENDFNVDTTTTAAPFPGASILGGQNVVILKKTAHREAAWEFMKWMEGKEAQQLMFKAGVIPTNRESEIPKEFTENPFYRATVTGVQESYLRPTIPELESLEVIFEKYLIDIFTGKISVEQGLNQAAEEMERLL